MKPSDVYGEVRDAQGRVVRVMDQGVLQNQVRSGRDGIGRSRDTSFSTRELRRHAERELRKQAKKARKS